MPAPGFSISIRTLLLAFLLSTTLILVPMAFGESDPAAIKSMLEKLRSGAPTSELGPDPAATSRVLREIMGSTQDESIQAKALKALEEIHAERKSKEKFSEALCQAVWKGELSVVKTLLEGTSNANVRSPGLHWSTPLHGAIEGGHNEIVELLLAHGADPNAEDYMGFRPLYWAIKEENLVAMNALLDKGVSVNGFTRKLSWGEEDLPLSLASRGSIKAVELLLARGADVNADPGTGSRPLLIAAHRPEIAARLLNAGADVNRPGTKEGATPLYSAANGLMDSEASLAATKLLLEHGADPNRENIEGRTALHSAVIGKSTPILELLIRAGGDVDRVDRFGFTPYGYANATANSDAMKLLQAKGARTEGVGFSDEEPLHRAAVRGDLETVQKLLDGGADATKPSANQWTPLHAAAFCVYSLDPKITDLLLKHGADPNAKGPHEWTPFHLASLSGNSRMVRDLLKAGGDPALKDTENNTPRDLAIRSGDFFAAKAVDRHMADPRQ